MLGWFRTPVPRPVAVCVIGVVGALLALPTLLFLPVAALVVAATCLDPAQSSELRALGPVTAALLTSVLFMLPMAVNLVALWATLNVIRLYEWARTAMQVFGGLLALLLASMLFDVALGEIDSSGDVPSLAERVVLGSLEILAMSGTLWAVIYLGLPRTRAVFGAAEAIRRGEAPADADAPANP